METLQDLVARRLDELGWTQERLAEHSGMSQEWVSKVYRGKIETPRRKSLFRLADALQVDREVVVMAAGFASSRDRAAALLAALPDEKRTRLMDLHDEIDEALTPVLDRPEVLDAIVDDIRHTVDMVLALSQQPPLQGSPRPEGESTPPPHAPLASPQAS